MSGAFKDPMLVCKLGWFSRMARNSANGLETAILFAAGPLLLLSYQVAVTLLKRRDAQG